MDKFIKPEIEYINTEKLKRIENVELLLSDLTDSDNLEKISNYAKQYDLDEQYLLNQIRDNYLLATKFAKDPNKQTFHETVALNFIQSLPFIDNCIKLSSGGEDALYVISGEIKKGSEIKNKKEMKSIDFSWKYIFKDKCLNFYATHKFTKRSGGGGSQDNQLNDVFNFHQNARDCIDNNVYLFSITDGDFYQSKYTKDKQVKLNKIDYMNIKYKGSRNIATTSNELLRDMIPVIIKWLNDNFNNDEIAEELDKLNYVLDAYKEEDH